MPTSTSHPPVSPVDQRPTPMRPPGRPLNDTSLHAAGPPTLTPGQLRLEQQRTLTAPRRRPNLLLRAMLLGIDLLYGRRASLQKFLVLEHLAQIPYRSWERVAQRHIARSHGRSHLAQRIQQRVADARSQHDNEQLHMLVLEVLINQDGRPPRPWRHRLLPRLLALPWQFGSWLLHLAKPQWSYRLNAAFEAHAEHAYMHYVSAHPGTEQQPFNSDLADRWTVPVTVADVLRQIGHDERAHKEDSQRSANPHQPAHLDEPTTTSRSAA